MHSGAIVLVSIDFIRRNWIGRALLGTAGGALALSLAACGSSGTTNSAADNQTSALLVTDAGTSSSSPTDSASGSGNAAHAGSIDVCALLTPAEASALATQFKLASDPAATYKLMTVRQPPPTTAYPSSACQFTIAEVTADNTGSEAIITVGIQPAQYLDKTGTKLDGLGDEAYDEGDYVEVRAGDVVLQSNQHSGASKDFISALYKVMIPKIT
jgi:hypothetical protein